MKSKILSHKIFEPYKLGSYTLKNRIMMSAMTRCRADRETGVPPADLYSKYFSQRAESAGIVVTDACWVHPQGQAHWKTPGIYTQKHIDAWKQITEAVHKKDGRIFAQIEHGGRSCMSHIMKGLKPLGPSPIAIRALCWGEDIPHEVPIEMKEEDIRQTIEDFANTARNAMKAGFDGVEIHAAGGYLLDQFLRDDSNKRTDEWGGSIENRCRLTLEVLDEVVKEAGADKVGIKLSPTGRLNDMFDSDPLTLFSYLVKKIDERGIAYIQIEEGESKAEYETKHSIDGSQIVNNAKTFGSLFRGTMVTNRVTFEEAKRRIDEGEADMVAFARMFISNPDLVERLKNEWPLTEVNYATFDLEGETGFTDYPKYKLN